MSRRDTRRSGLNSLSYVGVRPGATSDLITNDRSPTTNDKNFNIGDFWIDRSTLDTWMLVDKKSGALWIRFGTSVNSILGYITDLGLATSTLGYIFLQGFVDIDINKTATHSMTTSMLNLANGYTYIGTGASMTSGTIVSPLGTITVTRGANSIDLVNPGVVNVSGFHSDSGDALAVASTINLYGSTNISTLGGANQISIHISAHPTILGTFTMLSLSEGVVQIDNAGAVSSANGTDGYVIIGSSTGLPAWARITSPSGSIKITLTANDILLENLGTVNLTKIKGDTGTATEVGNNINIFGSTYITTAGSAHHIVVTLANSLIFSGSVTLSSFIAGVIQSSATCEFSSTRGTDGQTLIGGGTNAQWRTLTPTNSSIVITNTAHGIDIKAVIAPGSYRNRISADTSYATSSGGNINVIGGTNIKTTASSHTVTIDVTDDVSIATELRAAFGESPVLNQGGILYSSATGLLSYSNGTNGQVMIGTSQVGHFPVWAYIKSLGGSIDITNGVNSITLADPTTPAVIDGTTFLATAYGYPAGVHPSGLTPLRINYTGTPGWPSSVFFDGGDNITHTSGGNFVWIAPITGKFNFQMAYNVYRLRSTTETQELKISFVTSNRTYTETKTEPIYIDRDPLFYPNLYGAMSLDVTCDFDIGDTAMFYFLIPPPGSGYQWWMNTTNDGGTFISGFYIGA